MRLWHEALIPHLPRQQLLGQHRECCALRGLGWGVNHSTVNYVFQHPYSWLVEYHIRVMEEMIDRGYEPDEKWFDCRYRGKRCNPFTSGGVDGEGQYQVYFSHMVYPEHNMTYLIECLDNLKRKGAKLL